MYKLNDEVGDLDTRIRKFIPASLQYACRHWATHMCDASLNLDKSDGELIDAMMLFASVHFLHWLEALSLIGCLEDALPALRRAQSFNIVYVLTSSPGMKYADTFFTEIISSF